MASVLDTVIQQYKDSGLLVRGNDGQTPATSDDVNTAISNIVICPNKAVDPKTTNLLGFLNNEAPSYSASLLSGTNAPLLWYNPDYVESFKNKNKKPKCMGHRTIVAVVFKNDDISVRGGCAWDADSNLRDMGNLPNTASINKSTPASIFAQLKVFNNIGNYKYSPPTSNNNNPVYCHDNGKYLIAFDPLDGSQNIDPGLEVGAIFGIFSVDNDENIMKNGRNIVGAAYALFGTTMQFVIAYNNNVTYEIISSNDILIKFNNFLRMPLFGKYYCTNEANRHNRSNHAITKFFEILVEKKMSCRWGGCMVQDVHRILLQGGIFSYPLDKKNINGKLRLLYECYPMAYIVECAGGNAYLENGSDLLGKTI